MDENRLIKWVVVIVPVVAGVLAILPPQDRLKGGIDLVGGTSLLYEIDMAGLSSQEQQGLSDRVMRVLQKRVDPSSQMNLIWRPIGTNRLEIQMPRPPKESLERRQTYEEARGRILAKNVTRMELESALNAPADVRDQRLAELERGVTERKAKLDALRSAYDAYTAVRSGEDVEAEDAARQAYEGALDAVLATCVSPGRLSDVLSLPGQQERLAEIAKLRAEFPSYGALIDEVAEKHAGWAAKKGVLEDSADLKRRLRGAGVLEFRILAERDSSNPSMVSAKEAHLRQPIAPYVDQLFRRGPRPKAGDRYEWLEVANVQALLQLESLDKFDQIKNTTSEVVEKYAAKYYVLVHGDADFGLLKDGPVKWKLAAAHPDRDSDTGRPCVSFTLDPRGGAEFAGLTGRNINRRLAIVLDDAVQSAATIVSQIRERGRITGDFTPERVGEIVASLEAGSLPARLKEQPLMEKSIGPSLGEHNRRVGIRASMWGGLAVVAWMILYYRFAGLVADVALVLNILFVLAVMAMMEGTFTLPGIAGLTLTMGMAVDANVLVNERIREEMERGLNLKKAIKAGYEKALSAIVDSNATTLATCVILGYVGSEEVKGFAMTLGFGVLISMFTALFVTRLILTELVNRGWVRSLSMLRLLKSTNIDWMGLRRIFLSISTVVPLAGYALFLGVSFANPEALYDIEFLGGTSVQIELQPGITASDEDVRRWVTEAGGGDRPSAVGWLRSAADAIDTAGVVAGASTGQFEVSSAQLTAGEIEALMRTTMDDVIEREGVSGTGHAVVVATRAEAGLSVDGLKARLKGASDYARAAADRMVGTRVQTVTEEGAEGARTAFELVTIETSKALVEAAVVGAFGDNLVIERPISFTFARNAQLDAPYFPIDEGHRYLSDVIGGSELFDISRYKGGAVLVLDDVDPPQRIDDLQRRFREARLLPQFEQFEWRPYEVVGLAAGAGEERFSRVALLVVDENLPYYDNVANWEDFLAKVEVEQAKAALGSEKTLQKVVQFAPQVARQTQNQAIIALVLSLGVVAVYVWFRFGGMQYGLAAIIALIHDVGITLGLIALSHFVYDTLMGKALDLTDFKVDLSMIAALLTVIGYSLNDTIVVFDRIRENRGRLTRLTLPLINGAINQTLSRTILTGGTTIVVLIIIYLFGGDGVHGFAFAMLVGILTGTYSSIGVASLLLYHHAALRNITWSVGGAVAFLLIAAVSGGMTSGQGALLTIAGAAIAAVVLWLVFVRRRGAVMPVGA